MSIPDALQSAEPSKTRAFWSILMLFGLIGLLVFFRLWPWPPPNPLGTVPVTVSVYHNGQLIENAAITFLPLPYDAPLRPANGTTNSRGSCLITTWRYEDGAIPGPYKIGIAKIPAWSLKFADPALILVNVGTRAPGGDQASADPTRMYAEAARQEALPQEDDLPARYMEADTSGLKRTVSAEQANDFTFQLTD